MDSYDPNTLKLDEEFKEGLQNIRGYLMNLTSPQAAKCCGEWLQKLRQSTDERQLRNILLQRLVSQVQTRKLEYPFDRLPNEKPLYTLYEEGDASSWCTDDFETSTKETVATSVENVETIRRNGPDNWYNLSGGYQDAEVGKCPKPTVNCSPRKSPIRIKKTAISGRGARNEEESDKQLEINFVDIKDDNRNRKIKSQELSSYIEDYKSLLTDYKRIVNENISELADRLDTAIENNQIQKVDLKNLQSSLHDSWTARLQELETELISEVNKLECQLASDRSLYETKIEHLKQVILEKDDKINLLDSKIKQQSVLLREKMNSVKNEISMVTKENDLQYKKRYAIMKTEMSKLENMNKELIKQCQKNISMTVKDYETKIKSAKLMGADESMVELEEKIKQLEKYYQKIFQQYKRKIEKNCRHNKKLLLENLEL